MSRKEIPTVHEPLNVLERYLYAIAVRLDAIIEQNNSIIDYISKQNKVAITSNQIVEEAPKRKKSTKK